LNRLAEGRAYQENLGLGNRRFLQDDAASAEPDQPLDFSTGIGNQIYALDETWSPIVDPGPGPYFPIWQSSPVLDRDLVNFNLIKYGGYGPFIELVAKTGSATIGGIDTAEPGNATHFDLTTRYGFELLHSSALCYSARHFILICSYCVSFFAIILSFAAGKLVEYNGDPMSSIYLPVFDSYEEDKTPVGVIVAVINWKAYFKDLLPPNAGALDVVLDNSCQGSFTYQLSGEEVFYKGQGDLHDTNFDWMEKTANFENLKLKDDSRLGFNLNEDLCRYNLRVYPTESLSNKYQTNVPTTITVSVFMVFLFTLMMFLLYDRYVTTPGLAIGLLTPLFLSAI
jgi:hypothetical protein